MEKGLSAEENWCLHALNHLQQLPIKRDFIFSTQTGKRLWQLMNNHPDDTIQVLSSEVIDRLESLCITSKNAKKYPKDGSKRDKSSMSESKKQGKQRMEIKNDDENMKNRALIRERLAESLCKVAVEDDNEDLKKYDPYGVAAMVEAELFSTWGPSYNGPNKHKYRSLMFNIKDDKNPDFRRKVLLGVFQPDVISILSTEDMASDARRLEIQKIRAK